MYPGEGLGIYDFGQQGEEEEEEEEEEVVGARSITWCDLISCKHRIHLRLQQRRKLTRLRGRRRLTSFVANIKSKEHGSLKSDL